MNIVFNSTTAQPEFQHQVAVTLIEPLPADRRLALMKAILQGMENNYRLVPCSVSFPDIHFPVLRDLKVLLKLEMKVDFW